MWQILHLADIHLGANFGWLGEAAAAHRHRVWRTFEHAVKFAIDSKEVKLVLFAGDTFDSHRPDTVDIERFIELVKQLSDAGVWVAAIPGNHDYYAGETSVWGQVEARAQQQALAKLVVFNGLEAEQRIIEIEGVGKIALIAKAVIAQKSSESAIIGMAEIVKGLDSEPGEDAQGKVQAKIGIAHGGLEIGNRKPINNPIPKKDLEELAKSGLDYLALGDWHGLLQAEENLDDLEALEIWYPGSLEFLDRKQARSGNGLIVEFESKDLESKSESRVKVTPKKFSKLELTKQKLDLNQLPAEQVRVEIKKQANKNKIYIGEVSGSLAIQELEKIKLSEIEKELKSEFYFLKLIDTLDLAMDASDLDQFPEGSIPREFILKVEEKIKSKQIDPQLAQEVMQLGLATIRGK